MSVKQLQSTDGEHYMTDQWSFIMWTGCYKNIFVFSY